jgi:hypothetical protein
MRGTVPYRWRPRSIPEERPLLGPAFGKRSLFTNLPLDIPTGLHDRRRDELRADIAFAEVFLVHPSRSEKGRPFRYSPRPRLSLGKPRTG